MRFFRYSQTRTCHYFRAASYVHVHNDLAPARSHLASSVLPVLRSAVKALEEKSGPVET